jgi:hypothetical protein
MCIFLLIVERIIGIDWDYHPDSVTYFEAIGNYNIKDLSNIWDLSNSLHYFLVSALGSIELVLIFNIIITACGNQIIYTKIKKYLMKDKYLRIIMVIYLFHPYKLHLAVTLLKDPFVIFMLIIFLFTRYWLIALIFGLLYRNAFIFYTPLKNGITYKKIIYAILFVTYFFYTGTNYEGFEEASAVNFAFREYDLIPAFKEYGAIFGAILRMIIWPILTITGFFVIISPTLQFVPVAIGSMILFFILFRLKITLNEIMPVLIFLAIYACIAPGYTTYLRYVFPIICTLPYIILIEKK